MAWVYILRGSRRYYIGATENLNRRIAEHRRGSNHTTRRFSRQIVLAAAKEVPSMVEARAIELRLKRKKNPQLAIYALNSTEKLGPMRAAPKAFGVGSGFESRPTHCSITPRLPYSYRGGT
jgi:predicted GIY-YIG superfamily endonuclease